jgi:hypothetical protein
MAFTPATRAWPKDALKKRTHFRFVGHRGT